MEMESTFGMNPRHMMAFSSSIRRGEFIIKQNKHKRCRNQSVHKLQKERMSTLTGNLMRVTKRGDASGLVLQSHFSSCFGAGD